MQLNPKFDAKKCVENCIPYVVKMKYKKVCVSEFISGCMFLLWISCCPCLIQCDLSSYFFSPDFWNPIALYQRNVGVVSVRLRRIVAQSFVSMRRIRWRISVFMRRTQFHTMGDDDGGCDVRLKGFSTISTNDDEMQFRFITKQADD